MINRIQIVLLNFMRRYLSLLSIVLSFLTFTFSFLSLSQVAKGGGGAEDIPPGATSKDNKVLKHMIAQFPESDTNQDGVLTKEEWEAFNGKGGKKVKTATPTYEDVKYGPYERNVLDFFKAKSSEPTPVMFYMHGGGFLVGDKKAFRSNNMMSELLDNGISVVSINYRYSSIAPFPAPFMDAVRAIQFVRTKAKEWNIDPTRIGSSGASAGACMSIWIGVHDDFADPQNSDPVLHESSRLSVVAVHDAQTFLDQDMVKKYLYSGDQPQPAFMSLFAIKDASDYEKEEVKKKTHEASSVYHVSKDDPPIFIQYAHEMTPTPMQSAAYIHHPRFGTVFKEYCDKVGITCVVHYPGVAAKGGEELAFIKDAFNNKKPVIESTTPAVESADKDTAPSTSPVSPTKEDEKQESTTPSEKE
jgi:acetyl esterase